MVNVSIYEPISNNNSLDIKDFELLSSLELGENFAQSEEDELINFIVAREKVESGKLLEITIQNISNFFIITDFGYDKVDIVKKKTFDLQTLADEKNKIDFKNLVDNHTITKKKVRISVIKKLAENKKIIRERDLTKQK